MYTVYSVRFGDTIDEIARIYNISVDELKRLNGLDLDKVMMGDLLVVPNNLPSYLKNYTIVAGDTLYDIARRNNVSIETILLLNGLNKNDYLYPGTEIVIPTSDNIYMTKEGDTLSSVLSDTNTLMETLLNQNQNIYLLPEQMLILKK